MPYLTLFQEDPMRWSFTLQMRILLSMYHQKIAIDEGPSYKDGLVFVERCPESSLAFVRTALDLKMLTALEMDIFEGYFTAMVWRPSAYIRLCADTNTIQRRIERRSRVSEVDITREYLEPLASQYDALYDELSGPVAKVYTDNLEVAQVGHVILAHVREA